MFPTVMMLGGCITENVTRWHSGWTPWKIWLTVAWDLLSLATCDWVYLILSVRALHGGKEVLAVLLLEKNWKRKMRYCCFLSEFPYVKVKTTLPNHPIYYSNVHPIHSGLFWHRIKNWSVWDECLHQKDAENIIANWDSSEQPGIYNHPR